MEIKEQFAAAVEHCIKLKYGGYGSQKALAIDANVSNGDISNTIKRHFKKMPGPEKQVRIAKALGYELPEFLVLGRNLLLGRNPYEGVSGKEKTINPKSPSGLHSDNSGPFPRSLDVMALPIPKRPWAIKAIAAEANGLHGWSESAGDKQRHEGQETPKEHQRYFDGEITEVDLYNQYDRYFKKMVEKLKKGLEKEGL